MQKKEIRNLVENNGQMLLGYRDALNTISRYDEVRGREALGLAGVLTLGHTDALEGASGSLSQKLGALLAVMDCLGAEQASPGVISRVKHGSQLQLDNNNTLWAEAPEWRPVDGVALALG